MRKPYLTEPDEVAGLLDYRQNKLTYDQWVSSDYVLDMWRRKAYYDERQVEVNNENVTFTTDQIIGDDPKFLTPEQWNQMHSGPGWEDICSMLPDATQETCVKFFGLNLTPVIINNRQVVYSLPVKGRLLRVDGEEEKESTRIYTRLTKAAQHDLRADQLCKWTGLFTTAFQMFSYDERNKRVVRHNLEPWRVLAFESDDYSRDLQDPGVMVCVMMHSEDLTRAFRREERPVWQVWWKDRYWFEREPARPYKDRACTVEGTNENPFRDNAGNPVKPILSTKDVISDHIYERGSDMLIQQSQVIDRQLTSANYTVEYQGFAVPVIAGADPEEVEANPHSPGAAVVFRDSQASYQYANPNARPSEFMAAIRTGARTVARLYAVDPELVDPDSKVQSGVAKAQGRVALMERRKTEFPKWKDYEREAYWMTAVIWNTYNPETQMRLIDRFLSGDPSRPEEELVVEFAPLIPSVDELSDALANKTNLDLNLTTREEILATKKDVDLDTAKVIAAEFKKVNEKDRGMPLRLAAGAAQQEGLPRIGTFGNPPGNLDLPPGEEKGPGAAAGAGNLSMDRRGS